MPGELLHGRGKPLHGHEKPLHNGEKPLYEQESLCTVVRNFCITMVRRNLPFAWFGETYQIVAGNLCMVIKTFA